MNKFGDGTQALHGTSSSRLQNVTEGSYLSTNTGLVDGAATLFVVGNIDNTNGIIQQGGIGDVYLSNTSTTAASGVLATMTFKVIKYADSAISLVAGSPTLQDNATTPQS